GGEVQGGSAGQSSDIYYSYTGNRRNGIGYDAAGNLTNDRTQSFSYDATGQQTYASGIGAGGSAPAFTDDPLNPPNAPKTEIKLIHLTQLRDAVNQLRVRAGLAAVTTWNPDPDPHQNETYVHHNHIQQLRTKLEEALTALHLPVGGYAHAGPNQGDTIYAIDFQELRDKIKDAWTALAASALSQSYDGDTLRVKKIEYGATTYYLRSSVLSGQVIAEVDGNNVWQRGYVYAGGSLMAVQQGGVFWMHEDPITKSKRTTDMNGNVVSAIELDPWGADTNRSSSAAFQPRKYASYDRDGNGSDEAMFRRYNRKRSRFDQPDPYEGSYDFTNPQSLNRYAYVQNDPVNFVDPSGLDMNMCSAEFSYADCGGDDGFWGNNRGGGSGGGFGGDVAEYNREYGDLPAGVRGLMHIYNERLGNAMAGNGFMTNAELTRQFLIYYGYSEDGSLWTRFSISVDVGGSGYRPFDFGGLLDRWPPQGPFDRTFGWGEPRIPTTRVTLPGGEPIRMTPPRGVEGTGNPEGPRLPGFDPSSNLRAPVNGTLWQRWSLRAALAWRAIISGVGSSGDFIVVPNPALFRCQLDPNSCLPKRKT
ncbi:MAG TPA: RHS repeat-associated core domain-containing protein, partial [Pyrinomonadaceae bacterium]|nr:RHS repeat-associated core domain-containing protein [Pyrinomonadaceae bacterium]